MLKLIWQEVGIRQKEHKKSEPLDLKRFAASFFTLGMAVGSIKNDKLLP